MLYLSSNFFCLGDNSDKLCQICTGAVPGGKCTPSDPYAGFNGAFRCFIEAGEIAFLRHTTVKEMITHHYSFCKTNLVQFRHHCSHLFLIISNLSCISSSIFV